EVVPGLEREHVPQRSESMELAEHGIGLRRGEEPIEGYECLSPRDIEETVRALQHAFPRLDTKRSRCLLTPRTRQARHVLLDERSDLLRRDGTHNDKGEIARVPEHAVIDGERLGRVHKGNERAGRRRAAW